MPTKTCVGCARFAVLIYILKTGCLEIRKYIVLYRAIERFRALEIDISKPFQFSCLRKSKKKIAKNFFFGQKTTKPNELNFWPQVFKIQIFKAGKTHQY